MKYSLPSVVLRCVLGVLLIAGLDGCSLYHSIFHPYRLPTPKPSAEFKAQQKAAAKARKKNEPTGFFKKKTDVEDEEAATDVSTPTGGAIKTQAAAPEARPLPESPTVHYDKAGLLKKPKLIRRRINKPAPKPFKPWQSIVHFFKFKSHGKPNYSPDHRPAVKAPAEPDALPDAAPDATPVGKP
ncbi:hypothetical protein I2I05_13435 [Hymenobacter sp. BT683]|uniref:Uncharacterized protein n=1 Tax=Hymenobacter jeongseonensis TaxID=2791027 RepID=A0ABS0IJ64_9BACT|nr:hypothetical protein [Hymenobacter jeongseonensis]MBF9238402.1 hypothetical protein [Hymenobacter jeongseonensis]